MVEDTSSPFDSAIADAMATAARSLEDDGITAPTGRQAAHGAGYTEVLRVKAVDDFLGPTSPLWTYTRQMVQVAQLQGIDWRLLPVLAVKESSGGRNPCKGNPFGYGSCGPRWQFDSFTTAIIEVGMYLSQPPYAGLSLAEVFSMYQSGSAGPIDDPEHPEREVARQNYVISAMGLASQLSQLAGE